MPRSNPAQDAVIARALLHQFVLFGCSDDSGMAALLTDSEARAAALEDSWLDLGASDIEDADAQGAGAAGVGSKEAWLANSPAAAEWVSAHRSKWTEKADNAKAKAAVKADGKNDADAGVVAGAEDSDDVKAKVVVEAMDAIMELVGVEAVKQSILDTFCKFNELKRLPKHLREQLQAARLNFTFLGNSGTGKTTVAKLFGQVLHAIGARKSDAFVQVDATDAKSAGTDAFKKQLAAAKEGVLFVDEAYSLEPKRDARGREIASLIMYAAEEHRDSMTIILAGYEDDVRRDLFEWNQGFEHRFDPIKFEDLTESQIRVAWRGHLFDTRSDKAEDPEKKLRFMWNDSPPVAVQPAVPVPAASGAGADAVSSTMPSMERQWSGDGVQQADSAAVTAVVARRLARRAGKPGFQNHRTVRETFNAAMENAATRFRKSGSSQPTLTITMEDVIGPRPDHESNPQLK